MGKCNNVLREQGKPYPRTCAVCGLGPCKHIAAAATTPAPDVSGVMLEPILELWRDLVKAGGMPALTPTHVEAMAVALKRAATK